MCDTLPVHSMLFVISVLTECKIISYINICIYPKSRNKTPSSSLFKPCIPQKNITYPSSTSILLVCLLCFLPRGVPHLPPLTALLVYHSLSSCSNECGEVQRHQCHDLQLDQQHSTPPSVEKKKLNIKRRRCRTKTR